MADAPPKLPTPQRAWGCIVVNQCACPGLGSFAAGRRIVGSLQLLLTVTGFVLLMIGMLAFMANMVRTGDLPHEWTRPSRLGVIGFFVFATSWLWALTTSWSIWRELKRTNPR